MIKKIIKKIIMWESKEFELTPAKVLEINLLSIMAVALMIISINPFFELTVKIFELM